MTTRRRRVSARVGALPITSKRIPTMRDDVLCPMLRSVGDLWMFSILWRDVAKHERYAGIERCEDCTPSHRSF